MENMVKRYVLSKKVPNNYSFCGNFREGMAPVRKNNKWGFINKSGEEVVKPIYDDVRGFSEGLASVKNNSKWGFINKAGEEIVRPIYDFADGFNEGLARVCENDKYGFINKEGEEVVKPIYDFACSFNEGIAPVRKNKKWGFINKAEEEIVRPIYDCVYDFNEGLARVQKNGKYGFVNKEGKEIIYPDYDDIKVTDGLALARRYNEWYIIDLKNFAYEVSIDLQGEIIKKQFSKESEADEFAKYMEIYINKKIPEVKKSFVDDITMECNNCYKKSMN